jgi:uncharacterized membrane protein
LPPPTSKSTKQPARKQPARKQAARKRTARKQPARRSQSRAADRPVSAPSAGAGVDHEGVHVRLARLEQHLLGSMHGAAGHLEAGFVPAWRRVTRGEPRWPVSIAVLAAIVMQRLIPNRLATQPRWLLPGLALVLLVALIVTNPQRINRRSTLLRVLSLLMIGVLTAGNVASAARLVLDLLNGTEHQAPDALLLTGAAIWLTNVIVFSLWYWEFDRGGPAARAHATHPHPDFLFPQMDSPEHAPDDWEPAYIDYLYVSFTNAAAFSPTDVLPLSRWAKATMLMQSIVSLVTIALIIARAINILK